MNTRPRSMDSSKTELKNSNADDAYGNEEKIYILGYAIGRNLKTAIALIHDWFAGLLSIPLAALMVMGLSDIAWQKIAVMSSIFAVFALICFRLVGMYRGVWRYASVGDLLNITRATSLAVILFSPSTIIFVSNESAAYTVPLLQWLLLMLMLGGPRILYRSWRDGLIGNFLIFPRTSHDGAVSNVLLIGAGDAAELFIRSMQQSRGESGYRVVGLLDSSDDMKGREIHGVPVLGRPSDLDQVLARFENTSKRPQRLIFSSALPQRSADGSVHDPQDLLNMSAEDLATKFERYGLSVARLPSITEFKDNLAQGQGGVPLKPIAIEDILGRPQTSIDLGSIEAFLKGRRVLVTGCGGTIGGELTRQIASFKPSELILLDNGEFNLYSIDFDIRDHYPTLNVQSYLCCIRDAEALERVFESHKPEIVFHAAALKHVPLVELNPTEGILTNVAGTKNVAEAALKHEALAMVQISTDKAVNPTNVMGASKRLGEYYAQALDLMHDDDAATPKTRFMTVRFGNVLGSSGSVVPLFKKQLAKGGPLTVTHPEIKRYFMTVKEAVSLVLQASAQNIREQEKENRGQIFVLDMGEPMKIVDVARQMIRLSDLRPDKDIKIVFTGLRPGEKLYEELFDRNEKPVSTAMDGVMAAIPQPINLSLLRKTVSNLEAQARAGDEESILQTLASVVPGYSAEDYDDAAAQAKSKNQTKSKSKNKAKEF